LTDPGLLEGLPGAELVEKGLIDGAGGVESVEALLVAIAAPRLTWLGVRVPQTLTSLREPELRLYDELGRQKIVDPYSRYNALLRELVSFERALEQRVFQSQSRSVDRR
jgi:hypothetical protein